MARALKPGVVDDVVTPELESLMEEWGSDVLSSLGSDNPIEMRNPLIQDHLDSWREQRIQGITDTTRDRVTSILRDAVEEGVGIDEMKRRLRGYFEEAADYRAERIARTEVVSSSNAANLAAYQISGLVDKKEWLAVQDSSTRETHSDMDGQRRDIKEEFVSPSGARAQGPGLFGDPAEDINCRCTVRPIVNEAASPVGEERAAEWKSYTGKLEKWDKRVTSKMARVFGLWLGDAISAID